MKKISRILLALVLMHISLWGQGELSDLTLDEEENVVIYEYTQPGEEEYWQALLYFSLGIDRQKEAKAFLEQSIEKGFMPAVLRRGSLYAQGEGGYSQSNRKAYKAFLEAAESGEGFAMFNLAYSYAEGFGTWKNKKKAIEWLKKLIHPETQFYEGFWRDSLFTDLTRDEVKVVRDVEAQISMTKFDPVLGEKNKGHSFLGYLYTQDKEFEKAQVQYELASDFNNNGESGVPSAAFSAALNFALGQGTERDIAKAESYMNLGLEMIELQMKQMSREWLSVEFFDPYEMADVNKTVEEKIKDEAQKIQFEIGSILLKNFDVSDEDLMEAVRWFKMAADQGNVFAQFQLGVIYSKKGQPYDLEQSRFYFQKAWEGNKSKLAGINYAYLMANGLGGGRNLHEAEKLINKLRSFSGMAGQILVDPEYPGIITGDQLIEYERGLAQVENSEALYALGSRYFFGYGVDRNYYRTRIYTKEAADLGNTDAIIQLGIFHRFGILLEKDIDKAKQYFQRARSAGDYKGSYQLALLVYDQDDPLKNIFEKIELYEECLSQYPEDINCLEQLAICYGNLLTSRYFKNDEVGEKAMLAQVFEIYEKMINLESGAGASLKGADYQDGDIVEQSYTTALEYYQKAIEMGALLAHYLVGDIYSFGKGVAKDLSRAEYHYRQFVEGSYVDDDYINSIKEETLLYLVDRYESGESEIRNNERVINWIIALEDLGNQEKFPVAFDIWISENEYEKAYDFLEDLNKNNILKSRELEGWLHAQFAKCYENGWGVRKDPAKVVKHNSIAIENENPDAYFWAAEQTIAGGDVEKGLIYMKLAARSGSDEAHLYLSGYYQKSHESSNIVIEHLNKALELNSAEAMIRLARLSLEGDELAPSLNDALELAERAYNLEHKDADVVLDQLESRIKEIEEKEEERSSTDMRLG